VNEDDAALDHDQVDTQYISGGHIEVCKFTGDDHGKQRFNAVWSALKGLAEPVMADSGISPGPEDYRQHLRRPARFGASEDPKSSSVRGTALLDSLCSDKFHQYSANKYPTEGTCVWIQNKEQFQNWRSSVENTKLWIHGNPATGKTHLAKHTIDMLSTEEDVQVIECFLDGRLRERNNVEALLRSTMQQAAKLQPDVWANATKEIKVAQSGDGVVTWTRKILSELWPTFMAQAVMSSGRIAIVLDGFDEIPENDQYAFLKCLEACDKELEQLKKVAVLHATKHGVTAPLYQSLRILILSRWCLSLDESTLDFVQYKINEHDTFMDIRLTVQTALTTFARKARYSQDFQGTLCDAVTRGARGIYLWATVMMDDIKIWMPREAQLQQQLQHLPKSLAELYDMILGRIKSRPGAAAERTKRVLLWVVFCLEPLTLHELNAGLALAELWTERRGRQVDSDSITSRMVDPGCFKVSLVMMCGQLLSMSSRNHVQPVHRTLVQYLTTHPEVFTTQHEDWIVPNHVWFYRQEQEAHRVLGMLCAAYLMMPSFEGAGDAFVATDEGRARWEGKVQARVEDHALVRYSALCWSRHLALTGLTQGKDLDGQNCTSLQNITTAFAISWVEVWWYARKWRGSDFPVGDVPLGMIIANEERFDSSLVPPAELQWTDQPPSTDTLVASEDSDTEKINSTHPDPASVNRSPTDSNAANTDPLFADPSPTHLTPIDLPAADLSHTSPSLSTRPRMDRRSTNKSATDPLTVVNPEVRPRTSSESASTSEAGTSSNPTDYVEPAAQQGPSATGPSNNATSVDRYVFLNPDNQCSPQ